MSDWTWVWFTWGDCLISLTLGGFLGECEGISNLSWSWKFNGDSIFSFFLGLFGTFLPSIWFKILKNRNFIWSFNFNPDSLRVKSRFFLIKTVKNYLLTRLSSPKAAREGLPGLSSSVEPCLLRDEVEKCDSAEWTDIESHPNRVPIRLCSLSPILKIFFFIFMLEAGR